MRRFDAWFGAHQKIDRIARQHLEVLSGHSADAFPTYRQILKFEGQDGPDGIKRKTPAQDEPWHYYNPADPSDDQIIVIIEDHFRNLVKALKEENRTRAAFEAAWLAHALVDGLTPAHHYPYEAELIKLRGGAGIESRTTPKEKLLMPGETLPKQFQNNWKMWGDKGLLATHFAFEWGIAVMILPLRMGRAMPAAEEDVDFVCHRGVAELFKKRAQQVADLHMYDQFYKSAWTPHLAKQARRELMPLIVSTVTLSWYAAVEQSKPKKRVRK